MPPNPRGLHRPPFIPPHPPYPARSTVLIHFYICGRRQLPRIPLILVFLIHLLSSTLIHSNSTSIYSTKNQLPIMSVTKDSTQLLSHPLIFFLLYSTPGGSSTPHSSSTFIYQLPRISLILRSHPFVSFHSIPLLLHLHLRQLPRIPLILLSLIHLSSSTLFHTGSTSIYSTALIHFRITCVNYRGFH